MTGGEEKRPSREDQRSPREDQCAPKKEGAPRREAQVSSFVAAVSGVAAASSVVPLQVAAGLLKNVFSAPYTSPFSLMMEYWNLGWRICL